MVFEKKIRQSENCEQVKMSLRSRLKKWQKKKNFTVGFNEFFHMLMHEGDQVDSDMGNIENIRKIG